MNLRRLEFIILEWIGASVAQYTWDVKKIKYHALNDSYTHFTINYSSLARCSISKITGLNTKILINLSYLKLNA